VGGADVPCGRAKVMAPRAERVGIFFARTLEESAATRLAKLDHFADFLSKNIQVGAPRRSDDESSRPDSFWKLFWTFREGNGLRTWRFENQKAFYNSADAFHRGIRGDSYENDSFSGLNASDSTVKPPTDGFRSARGISSARARLTLGSRSPLFLRRNVANARKEGFAFRR
jgi:hypothetical protein